MIETLIALGIAKLEVVMVGMSERRHVLDLYPPFLFYILTSGFFSAAPEVPLNDIMLLSS